MPSAELIQFGEQIANLHRRRIEDAPASGGPPALCCGQATVKRFSDHVGHRCTALPRDRANPLVTLIVDENLQPMRQHTHTLACTCGAVMGTGSSPSLDLLGLLSHDPDIERRVPFRLHGSAYLRACRLSIAEN